MSYLTIQKELAKKEYEKTPVGIAEKKMRKLYDTIYLKKIEVPEDVLKQRDEVREKHEKKYGEYVEKATKRDKENWKNDRDAVDKMLLESFTKEISLLEPIVGTTTMSDK